MGLVMMKTFNDVAEPVVFEVQPQHVGHIDFVREHGTPRFVRHAGQWLAFTPNGAVRVGADSAATLEDMKMDFAQATGWGFQIREKCYLDGRPHETWKWVRPTGGQPYVFETEAAGLAAAKMCYPETLMSSVRIQARGWQPLPCNVVAHVDVRACSTPCEEDKDVEGRYEVEIDAEHAPFAGDLALDVFHAKIGIEVLDDFEIRVFEERTGKALTLQDTWTATDVVRADYLGKIESEPVARYCVEVGSPGSVLYVCAEVLAEDEKMAIQKMQNALNYPQEGMDYRAKCLERIENKKGVRP